MHSRIAPLNTRPVHDMVIGYLRELTVAVKVEFYDLREQRTYSPVLDHEMLAKWAIVHRPQLTRCNGYRGGFPRFDDRHVHEEEVNQIDAIVEKLKAGLDAKSPTRDITSIDIETLSRAYRALDVCEEKLIWS